MPSCNPDAVVGQMAGHAPATPCSDRRDGGGVYGCLIFCQLAKRDRPETVPICFCCDGISPGFSRSGGMGLMSVQWIVPREVEYDIAKWVTADCDLAIR